MHKQHEIIRLGIEEKKALMERLKGYRGIFDGMTDEEVRAYRVAAAEAEVPCVRCKRVILAGCRDPLCGQEG